MAKIHGQLHPENTPTDDFYPNIEAENIPNFVNLFNILMPINLSWSIMVNTTTKTITSELGCNINTYWGNIVMPPINYDYSQYSENVFVFGYDLVNREYRAYTYTEEKTQFAPIIILGPTGLFYVARFVRLYIDNVQYSTVIDNSVTTTKIADGKTIKPLGNVGNDVLFEEPYTSLSTLPVNSIVSYYDPDNQPADKPDANIHRFMVLTLRAGNNDYQQNITANYCRIQIFIELVSNNYTEPPKTYIRCNYANSTWSDWILYNSESVLANGTVTTDKLANGAVTTDKLSDDIYISKIKPIIVAKENGDYTSIRDAVANSTDGDIIYIRSGTYENEIINAWGRNITIIGQSRDTVIIKNNLGNYSQPPLEMSHGVLKNVTIIAEYSDTGENNGYAVHVEDNGMANQTFDIENCTLISYGSAAIGIGLREGANLYIRNCDLISYGTREDMGTLYFHDSTSAQGGGVQSINVSNCFIYRENGYVCRILKLNSTTEDFRITFTNNYFRNNANKSTPQILIQYNYISQDSISDLPNTTLTDYSCNNNIEELNV